MIIAVDFDGTLHTGQYPSIGVPVAYSKDVMRKLMADGHYIIINTCRSGERLLEAINWLLAQDIPFHRVNDNNPDSAAKYGSNSRKIYAHCYVDDKQVGGLPSWHDIYDYITNKESEYRNSLLV